MNLLDQLTTALSATYTIERELGGGGMSRVFLAVELALGRQVVVVKVLPVEATGQISTIVGPLSIEILPAGMFTSGID